MKSLGIVISDGVGFRNFVLSEFINEAVKSYGQVIIFSAIPREAFSKLEIPNNVLIEEIEPFIESRGVWFFRKMKEVAHLYLHRTSYGINDNLVRGYPKSNSKRALIIKLIYFVVRFFHSEKAIKMYERIQYSLLRRERIHKLYKNQLKKYNFDCLFFTHQRPPFVAPFLGASKSLKIVSSTFIFSWDNLASKGRMLGEFDNYFVWSELMKSELIYYYPRTSTAKVHIVGTPQFEPYVMDMYSISELAFYKKMNLDSTKKIICYSCADADIGRNDEDHIRSIQNFIDKNENIQLLVRTSPAEDGKRFKKLMDQYPNIKWNFPKWNLLRSEHSEEWSQRVPTEEDLIDLKAILQYCHINVNMLSTMSLDFMIFDKPVINTVFGNGDNGLYNDQRFLNYKHYIYVIESNAVTVAKTEEELHEQLIEAIETPNKREKCRKEVLDFEIGAPLKGTSARIINVLKSI